MSDSSAQRVRVGPFAVSVDKQKPLIGAKISKVRRVGPVDERARATRLPAPPRPRPKGAARTVERAPLRRRPFESDAAFRVVCRRETFFFHS